jgi:hypothetical protein
MSYLMEGRQMSRSAQIAGRPMDADRNSHVRYALGAVGRLLELDDRTAVRAAMLGAMIVVLIGLPLSAALNIWLDEAFTLHSTGAGPLVAWAQAITFDGQPPLYFVLESLWRELNETSVVFARVPSMLFAAAAVAIIVLAVHRVTPRIPSFVVALVTAINPIVIWAATEMRLYALVLLVGAVLTWTFVEGFLVEGRTLRWRAWYAIFAIVGLYTQYYIGFIFVAHAITILALRRHKMWSFLGVMAIVALAFMPFIPVAIMHVTSSGDFVTHTTFTHAVHAMLDTVLIYVLPHNLNWTGAAKYVGFCFIAILAMSLLAVGYPRVINTIQFGVLIQWFASVLILSVVFGIAGLPLDFVSHAIILAPSSLLVAFLFIESSYSRRLIGYISLTIFTIFALMQLQSQYHPPFSKHGDWQNVAAMLAANDKAVPIAVIPAEFAVPLSWYLPRAIIPIPKPMPFTLDYVRATTLTGESDVSRVLAPVQAQSKTLWVVTSDECPAIEPAIYNYHCHFLEAYLNEHYRIIRSVVFHGALARLYENSPRIVQHAQINP